MGEEHQIYQDWLNQQANITIDTSDVNTQEWDDWITQYTDLDLDIGDYSNSRLGANDISLTGGK